jgi:Domain of unknown function (DUF1844)
MRRYSASSRSYAPNRTERRLTDPLVCKAAKYTVKIFSYATFPAMAQDDTDAGFQVRDRRRRPEEEPAASPVEERQPPITGRPASPQPPAAGPRPPGERSLVGLFMMLGSLALAGLEGVQDPATGQVERDPQQAAEVIDMLMLLRDKTDGHRTSDETRVLEELIYDLQIRYVKATRPS